MLMMHEITVCAVEVAMPSRFGQSESYCGQDNRSGLREWTMTSAWICTNGRVGSRKGGTSTPFVGSCRASSMCSHLGGTHMWLFGRR